MQSCEDEAPNDASRPARCRIVRRQSSLVAEYDPGSDAEAQIESEESAELVEASRSTKRTKFKRAAPTARRSFATTSSMLNMMIPSSFRSAEDLDTSDKATQRRPASSSSRSNAKSPGRRRSMFVFSPPPPASTTTTTSSLSSSTAAAAAASSLTSPSSSLSMRHGQRISLEKTSSSNHELLLCSANDITAVLTNQDRCIFRDLNLNELESGEWSNEDTKRSAAPTVMAYIDRFNTLSTWAKAELAGAASERERASLLKFFVRVLLCAHQVRNYSLAVALVAAMESAACPRAWALVPQKYLDAYGEVSAVVSFQRNFATLRDLLRNTSEPAVPYLGTYMQDIAIIRDGMQHLSSPEKRDRTTKALAPLRRLHRMALTSAAGPSSDSLSVLSSAAHDICLRRLLTLTQPPSSATTTPLPSVSLPAPVRRSSRAKIVSRNKLESAV